MEIKNNDLKNLFSFADAIIPADENMPSASEIISVEDLKWLLEKTQKYSNPLKECLDFVKKEPATRVVGGVQELTEIHRIEILNLMQAIIPEQFVFFIEVIYLLYYSKNQVHEVIGWTPDESLEENKLNPFDESILENIKKREPFWKKV